LHAAYVVACDGARSPIRGMIGQESKGRSFRDRFLIADVKMEAGFPPERWFWFDPPFHPNQSVLLHRQPDNVWRIDFQLGADADPDEEKKPERVIPRIQALLGRDAQFELEWVSVYTFSCSRMETFRHGRILFAGDAAHCVSPFGARGANSGVQDAENLAWKLKLVLAGEAPDALLDTYDDERGYAANENLQCSTRATDFITPKNNVSRMFRDATLKLSKNYPFARRLVNSGRLSLPTTLLTSPLNTPDCEPFGGEMAPGAPSADAPVNVRSNAGWFLAQIGGDFAGVYFSDGTLCSDTQEGFVSVSSGAIPIKTIVVVPKGISFRNSPLGCAVVEDSQGLLWQRFDARAGTFYLVRPDQHVCGRWRRFNVDATRAALARATCGG
jgi:3-(3-hydroxy-phenyl)propionate hydroxylase